MHPQRAFVLVSGAGLAARCSRRRWSVLGAWCGFTMPVLGCPDCRAVMGMIYPNAGMVIRRPAFRLRQALLDDSSLFRRHPRAGHHDIASFGRCVTARDRDPTVDSPGAAIRRRMFGRVLLGALTVTLLPENL